MEKRGTPYFCHCINTLDQFLKKSQQCFNANIPGYLIEFINFGKRIQICIDNHFIIISWIALPPLIKKFLKK